MIPVTNTGSVTNFLSQTESSDFTIQASGHMFSLLFKNLYADPVSSVVREICANAYDAHVQANNQETPFEIWIPNGIEHNLIIKDYGCGLSDEDVWKYLSCAGESGKRETNTQQGLFGIGGKSMMAVTDSYTIESRFNGNKSIFLVFIQENGIPTMTKQKQETTDEDNGITFIIPVSDYVGYEKAIKNQLTFFDPKPIVMNCDHFEWHPVETKIQNEYGGVYTIDWIRESKYWVKMGNILYPFELGKIEEEYHKIRICNFPGKVILNFDIGEINVVPSRESISYDSVSLEKLNQKISLFIKEIDDVWETRLNVASTVKDFYGEVVYDIYQSDATYLKSPFFVSLKKSLIDFDGSEFIHNGGYSNYGYKFPNFIKKIDLERDNVLCKYQKLSTTRNIERNLIISRKNAIDVSSMHPFNDWHKSSNGGVRETIWVIVDTEKNLYDRFKNYFIQHPDKTKYIDNVVKLSKSWENDRDFKEIYEYQKNFPNKNITIIKTSEMPYVTKKKKEQKDKVVSLNGIYDLEQGKIKTIKNGSILIKCENTKIKDSGKYIPFQNDEWKEICKITTNDIYRVSGTCSKKTLNHLKEMGCIDLDDYVKQALLDTRVSVEFINYLVYQELAKKSCIPWNNHSKYNKRIGDVFIPKEIDGNLPKYLNNFENLIKCIYDHHRLTAFFISATLNLEVETKFLDINVLVKQQLDKIITKEMMTFNSIINDLKYAKESTIEFILNMFEKEKEND